jgi:uncharacterized protein (TIGR03000 family)
MFTRCFPIFILVALVAGAIAPATARADGLLDGEPAYRPPAVLLPYTEAGSYYPYTSWGAFNLSNYPTYMTSINYPLIYGAFDTFPYSTGVYTFGAMRSQYSTAPTGYSLLYLPPAAGLDYRPMPYTPRTLSTAGPATLTARSPAERTAIINVEVPSDAEVYIDGHVLPRTGSQRQFVTPPIESGRIYHYDIRATWTEGGREISQTQRLALMAGDRKSVSFMPARPTTSQSTLRGTIR